MNNWKKDHLRWAKELKQFFHDWMGDIPRCEICNTTEPPIDIAHSKKRRFIRDKATYMEAAMLCRTHHNDLEFGGHERMRDAIRQLIERRAVQQEWL